MPSQTLGAVDAASGDPRLHGALAQRPPALWDIVTLVGMDLAGRRQGRPRPWRTGGTASISSSKRRLSWMFAAVRRTASGMPLASVIRGCLDPARPRLVGLGPVS